MGDLITRLEALTGPNFEIEQEIGRLMNPNATRLSVLPAYTASIDAAMTLVPEGCMWNVGGNPNGGFASAGLFGAAIWQGIDQIQGEAPTPAIAMCIAALKARNLP